MNNDIVTMSILQIDTTADQNKDGTEEKVVKHQ